MVLNAGLKGEAFNNFEGPVNVLVKTYLMAIIVYCKFGKFRENFIFAKCVKSHICDVKNSRPGHDLPISVKDRGIARNHEDFIFTKLCICEVSRK